MEEKKTRRSKASYVDEAIGLELSDRETLENMSTGQIKELIADAKVIPPDPVVVEEKPSCDHDWRKVKVLDPKGNYLVMRCTKCAEEKPCEPS